MTDYISREAAMTDFESCNAENPRPAWRVGEEIGGV